MRVGVASLAAVLGASLMAQPAPPRITPLAESMLRDYTGVYQWAPNGFVYLQLWKEFSGFSNPGQLTGIR
jgi:hypothetical protein